MRCDLLCVVLLMANSASVALAQWSDPSTRTLPSLPVGQYAASRPPEPLVGAPGGAGAATPVGVPAVAPLAPGCSQIEDGVAPCGQAPCVPCPAVCGPPGRFWASAEYLLWWIKDSKAPPLVTISPPSSGAVLGQPGTLVLFGGSAIDNDVRSGGRFQAGYWLNCEQTVGLEAGYLFLGTRSVNFLAGTPTAGAAFSIGRPFFNVITGAEDSELVSQPGRLTGTVAASLSSRLQGGELNGICNLCCGCNGRLDLLGGFRYLELDEGLGIGENLAVPPTLPIIGGTTFLLGDQFSTQNRFYGGQVGARAEVRWGNLFVNLLGKVALGTTHQVVEVAGSTVIGSPGQPTTVANGGLLALPSNSGHFSRDRFAVLPEAGVNVGYQVTPHLRAFVGYSFLYWSNVVRPGDQIDRAVNPTQLPVTSPSPRLVGAARPQPFFRDADFWAQGINFGLAFRY